MSTARRTHASPYDWIVYKRESKAREKERGGQVVPLEVLYDLASRDRNLRQSVAICLANGQYRNMRKTVREVAQTPMDNLIWLSKDGKNPG